MPWSKIFDYKDKFKDHYDEVMDKIVMVCKEDMAK